MKKLTLIIVAVIAGFVFTSCGTSPKESILKATEELFTKAEAKLADIKSAEDFMANFKLFEEQKDEFVNNIFAPYIDDEGNIKRIKDAEMEEIQQFMYERATAYNKLEGEKCTEFLAPAMDKFEQAIEALYAKFVTHEEVAEEEFDTMIDNVVKAEEDVNVFADYDNVAKELQDRYQAANAKWAEMFEEDVVEYSLSTTKKRQPSRVAFFCW